MGSYKTGGIHAPKGLASAGGHANSNACDPTQSGAGMGTSNAPEARKDSGPGGKGSSGTPSKSSPKS